MNVCLPGRMPLVVWHVGVLVWRWWFGVVVVCEWWFGGWRVGVIVLLKVLTPMPPPRDRGLRIRVLGWGDMDMKYGVWDLAYGAWGLGSGFWDLGSGVWDLGSGVREKWPGLRDPVPRNWGPKVARGVGMPYCTHGLFETSLPGGSRNC